MSYIHLEGSKLFFPKFWLGLNEAYFWIGSSEFGEKTNKQVAISLGRFIGKIFNFFSKRPSGLSAVYCKSENEYFIVDTSKWPDGFYRLNAHGKIGEYSESGRGTRLDGINPEVSFSWAGIEIDSNSKPFIYKEPNGKGLCIRIKKEHNQIFPAGNI